MRHLHDVERRTRLARRHAVSPAHRAPDPLAATRAMTVLHATEPATVHLSLQARVDGLTVADVDRVLYDERTVVKQLAMRRTLFCFPRELLPAAWGSASARVAAQLRPRLAREVEAGGLADDGAAWLDAACAAVLAHLADGREASAQAIREALPELTGRIDLAVGKSYGANVSIAPRVLTQLAVEHALVRGRNGGHWRVSRPQWTLMSHWLGEEPTPLPEREGYAALVAAWLRAFGPGTRADLQWWLGSTVGAATRALADVGAVEVALDGGETGWVLPDDLDAEPEVEPWAALLPVLDPSVMGWKQRDFFLGPHAAALFDRNGNAGTTAWWDGRVVGCWVQDDAATVEVRLLEDVPPAGRAALDAEAARLTTWLDGVRVSTVYPSPAMKG
ncbi:winged helix DNA-binding domain-containing protein [Nocardioides taihuensis]|uniref:Winged helix DNA-binding domain-containing protein n=1 Tax=Nocardioides taihuensis TaxID=1835606 RepID=A0ABW0BQ34_9ACTN